jgi:Tfp pilus assembly protein PilN
MDLKKEIKLSDLFRRNGRDATGNGDGADASADAEPKARRLFSRTPKEPKAKEPKEPKAGKGSVGAAAKTAPPVPHIPLMRAFDLLPKEHTRQSAERRPGIAQIAVALVEDKRSERDQLKAQLAELEVQAKETSSGGTSGLEDERLARTGALATALSGRVAWDRLLREISLVLPGDVYLTALTVQSPTPAAAPAAATTTATTGSTPTTHFAIAGSTDEQQDVALLLSRLAILPELSGVQLVSSQRGDDGDITFTINAAVRHEVATP